MNFSIIKFKSFYMRTPSIFLITKINLYDRGFFFVLNKMQIILPDFWARNSMTNYVNKY